MGGTGEAFSWYPGLMMPRKQKWFFLLLLVLVCRLGVCLEHKFLIVLKDGGEFLADSVKKTPKGIEGTTSKHFGTATFIYPKDMVRRVERVGYVESAAPVPPKTRPKVKKPAPKPKEKMVYRTRTGKCYHKEPCGPGEYYEVPLSEAKRTLEPCKKCYGNQ